MKTIKELVCLSTRLCNLLHGDTLKYREVQRMRGTIVLHPGSANAIGQCLQQVAAGETISHAEAMQ
jgi:hypothetical protein